jgi:4-hydroxy-tetrahydrodipicolinate reductase
MGKAIERIALSRGHDVVSIIDVVNTNDFSSETFRSADVAIEFTTPHTAFDNYMRCFDACLPVVSGTTGWLERFDEVRQLCLEGKHTFFYASNFSIGVNIFFALNTYLAKIMNNFPAYDVQLTEIHHHHKMDTPSGTAITLAGDILRHVDRKTQWQPSDTTAAIQPSDLPIQSIREGEIPGTHEVAYVSHEDTIHIRHEAKSREGFALGAVVAAEFTVGRKGLLGMEDLLTF